MTTGKKPFRFTLPLEDNGRHYRHYHLAGWSRSPHLALAYVTRNDYRRQTVRASHSRRSIFSVLIFIATMPLLLPVFLGDIFATPFVTRRHESTFRWLLFMIARFLGPAIIAGVGIGFLVRRLS